MLTLAVIFIPGCCTDIQQESERQRCCHLFYPKSPYFRFLHGESILFCCFIDTSEAEIQFYLEKSSSKMLYLHLKTFFTDSALYLLFYLIGVVRTTYKHA